MLCASKCNGLLCPGIWTEEKEGGRGCWSWKVVMGAPEVMSTLGSQSSSLGPTALWLQRQSHDRGQCPGSHSPRGKLWESALILLGTSKESKEIKNIQKSLL